LIRGLRERIDLSELEEFTVEMNPATVSAEKAAVLRKLGVNRVSMGVQSWDDGLLATPSVFTRPARRGEVTRFFARRALTMST
jgi:coproporphyrinogen III oxidase-like Fe-S oxidoreductase